MKDRTELIIVGMGDSPKQVQDHKWFDPECHEKGCQSLIWKERAQAGQGEWIAVSERLPSEGQIVLVYEDDKVYTNWIPYANSVHESQRGRFQSGHDYVTYWMPLPALPEDK